MLTKSDYLNGLQCLKFLWVSKNDRERIPEPSDIDKAKFKQGELVGEYAKKLFSEGVDLSGLDFKENIKKTKQNLGKRVPLFEAGIVMPFSNNESVFSRADVLVPVSDFEWDIVEVKMGTKVKDLNIHDVAFQKYVYEEAGLKIRNCYLMHVNNEFVFDKEIVPKDFFVKTDISEKVEEFSIGIKEKIKEMFNVIDSEEPEFDVKNVKTIEYGNFLLDEFMNSLPENNVFEFYRIRKDKAIDFFEKGVISMNEIPDSVKLNDKQKIQKDVCMDEKHVDEVKIRTFLEGINYPVYYLDFETINPCIPKFQGMKPYQRIPFQFSLHIQRDKEINKESLEHVGFLASGKGDSRLKFLQCLKDNLGQKEEGDIIVYNQSFEKGVLREAVEAFPEFKDWYENNIEPRIKDLWDVFKNFWFYHRNQKGSASIKAVLPLFSDLNYKELDIGKGDRASYEWERITFLEDVSEEEEKKIRNDLEKYCELDTLAEFEIISGLWKEMKN